MEINQLLEQKAIDAAVNSDWKKAVKINKEMLVNTKDDVDANLRLGYAYLQSNKLRLAKKTFLSVLKLQPKNNIAEEHLERINILNSKKLKRRENCVRYNSELFIEVPGKTRAIHLVNLGRKEDLAGINIGERVILKEKRRKLEARTETKEFIGNLPDDISKRLMYFIKEKSEYCAHIKEVNLTHVVVFIREITKGKRVKNYPSFPSNPHVMLSDIQHIDQTDAADEDIDEGGIDGIELSDDTWEEYEEEKDISSIVQLEEEEEEEE